MLLIDLIIALQKIHAQHPGAEATICLKTKSGCKEELGSVACSEDDNEMAREHGRACGKPQIIVELISEEAE